MEESSTSLFIRLLRQTSDAIERLRHALDANRVAAREALDEVAMRCSKIDDEISRIDGDLIHKSSLMKEHGQALSSSEASLRDEHQRLAHRVSVEISDIGENTRRGLAENREMIERARLQLKEEWTAQLDATQAKRRAAG